MRLDISIPTPPYLSFEAVLYINTQLLSSDHNSSVGFEVIRRCSWMPTMSTPASVQPANSWWVFPCWYKVRTLYVETIRGLKAGRRQFSRPSVRVGVPSSRWPFIESSFDSRPATFDFVLVFFLVIFVTELVPCNSSNPVWQAVPRGWSALGASGEWFVGFSFPLVPMDLTIHTTLLYDWEREKDKGIVTAPVGTHTSICPTKENEGCCPLSCQATTKK